MARQNDDHSTQVRSLDRGLLILDSFIKNHTQSLHQVSSLLELPKSTIHRLLTTLHARGYVTPTNESGVYRLGLKGIWLTSARNRIYGQLQRLQEATKETVNFGMVIGQEVEYIDRINSDHALRWGVDIGSRIQMHCSGMGKVILAYRDDLWPVDQTMTARTAHTITEWAELQAQLDGIRHQGYALDDEEFIDGVTCLAVPVRDITRTVVGALSVSGPSVRFTKEAAHEHAPLCIDVARSVSEALGYRLPNAEAEHA